MSESEPTDQDQAGAGRPDDKNRDRIEKKIEKLEDRRSELKDELLEVEASLDFLKGREYPGKTEANKVQGVEDHTVVEMSSSSEDLDLDEKIEDLERYLENQLQALATASDCQTFGIEEKLDSLEDRIMNLEDFLAHHIKATNHKRDRLEDRIENLEDFLADHEIENRIDVLESRLEQLESPSLIEQENLVERVYNLERQREVDKDTIEEHSEIFEKIKEHTENLGFNKFSELLGHIEELDNRLSSLESQPNSEPKDPGLEETVKWT